MGNCNTLLISFCIVAILFVLFSHLAQPASAIAYDLPAKIHVVGNITDGKQEYRIGIMAPDFNNFTVAGLNLNSSLVTLEMTIKKWQPQLLPGYYFKLVSFNTECDFAKHSMAAARMYIEYKIHAFFGPMCISMLSWTATVAREVDVPVITVGVPYRMQNPIKDFSSLMPPFNYEKTPENAKNGLLPDFAATVNQTLMRYDWASTFALIFLRDYVANVKMRDNLFQNTISALDNGYDKIVGKSKSLEPFKVLLATETLENGTKRLKRFDNNTITFHSWTRVLVVSMEPKFFRQFMWNLFHDLKFPIEQYAILFLDIYYPIADSDWIQPWRDINLQLNHERNQRMKYFFRHVLYFRMQPVISGPEKLEPLKEEYNAACERSSFTGCELPPQAEHLQFAAATSDGLRLFMQAMNQSLEKHKDPLKLPLRMTEFMEYIAGKTFPETESSYASNTFDYYGKRVTPLNLWRMFDLESGNFSIHVTFKEDGTNETFSSGIPWIDGQVPKTPPDCGYENEKCKEPDRLKYLVTFVTLGSCIFVIVVLVVGFFIYRKVKLEEELNKMIWKIKHDELDFSEWKTSMSGTAGNEITSAQTKSPPNFSSIYQKNLQNHLKKVSTVSSMHSSHKSSLGSANASAVGGQLHAGSGRFSVVTPSGSRSPSIFAIRRTSQNQSPMALGPKNSVVAGTAFENSFSFTRPEPRYVFARFKKMKVRNQIYYYFCNDVSPI